MVDIGDKGRQSDGGVFTASKLGYAMDNDLLSLLDARCLNSSGKKYPYVFVGDEAFALKPHLIKPYPRSSLRLEERVANYCISRARRQVENVFGICASRFRIFGRSIVAHVDTVAAITKAIVALHNFLMFGRTFENGSEYYQDVEHGSLACGCEVSDGLAPLTQDGFNNYSREAKNVRDDFRDYFNSPEGSVPWKWDCVNSTENPFDKQ